MGEMSQIKPTKSGYIEADNSKIYYEYFGNGDKEPVALLNGVAMFTKSWYNYLPMLINEFDVILYDFLGQGNSTSEDVPYSLSRFCDYLTMILDELKIDKIHIMGISYSAIVATEYARLHEERLYTLTYSGGFYSYEEIMDYTSKLAKKLIVDGHFDIWVAMTYATIFGETFMVNVKPLFDAMKVRLRERYQGREYSLIRLIDSEIDFFSDKELSSKRLEELKNLKVPTLIISGKQDRVIPLWLQEKVVNAIPNNKWIQVDDCGHVVYIEQAVMFFETLKKFMRAKSIDF